MSGREISSVWERIEVHAGQNFRMIRGGTFRYQTSAGHVILDRINQKIPKSHFQKALALVPMVDTTRIQNLRGPSFIFAVLMDARDRSVRKAELCLRTSRRVYTVLAPDTKKKIPFQRTAKIGN